MEAEQEVIGDADEVVEVVHVLDMILNLNLRQMEFMY